MSGVAEPTLRKIQRLQRELTAARKALSKVQWRSDDLTCPSCGDTKPHHARGCQVEAALRSTRWDTARELKR